MEWAETKEIALCIQPRKPQQNAYAERYNRTVRHERLDQNPIESIEEAQEFATQWLWMYDNERPNRVLAEYPRTETENGCVNFTVTSPLMGDYRVKRTRAFTCRHPFHFLSEFSRAALLLSSAEFAQGGMTRSDQSAL
jgi:hypothetical protein